MKGYNVRRTTLLLLLISILAFATTPAPTASASPQTDQLDLAPWKGQVVWLDFWASWCLPCRASFPWMEEMRKKYDDRGLVIVTVNEDQDRAAADRFLVDQPAGLHHIFDPEGKVAEAFTLDAMPTSILFDRSGRPVHRHAGFFPGETAEYERHIVELLASKTGVDGAALPAALLPTDSGKDRKGRVRPWQRDLLARAEMSLGCDPLDLEFDDHIYFSKEASSGGRGFGGGGCGCN